MKHAEKKALQQNNMNQIPWYHVQLSKCFVMELKILLCTYFFFKVLYIYIHLFCSVFSMVLIFSLLGENFTVLH